MFKLKPVLKDLLDSKVNILEEANTYNVIQNLVEKIIGQLKNILKEVDQAKKHLGLTKIVLVIGEQKIRKVT